jgi:hypothetical protein
MSSPDYRVASHGADVKVLAVRWFAFVLLNLSACDLSLVTFEFCRMQRPSLWPLLVVVLLGILFLREPRFQRLEQIFLHWLINNSRPMMPAPPLTVVEIGSLAPAKNKPASGGEKRSSSASNEVSPLESALLLQAALDFKPTVIAFEPVLRWRAKERDQAQIFIDQAMRVPRLVMGTELTATPDPDAPVPEIPGFTNVTGKRGDLVEFSGISRQPSEEMRILSTPGFINMPKDVADSIHVPLLFQYRGEVIPSLALQTVLLWMRVPLNEVKVHLGSHILLPNGEKIPIRSDGTLLVSPNAARRARHLTMNELLLAAEQHERDPSAAARFNNIRDQIVLARTPSSTKRQQDISAAAIATIQTRAFIRRVSWIYDCVVVLIAASLSGAVRQFSRVDLVLGGIAFTAAYCLIALAVLSRWFIWLPGFLPLGAVWVLVIYSLVLPKTKDAPRTVAIAAPPPTP